MGDSTPSFPPPQPDLVLRDTLYTCEAYGMRTTEKEKTVEMHSMRIAATHRVVDAVYGSQAVSTQGTPAPRARAASGGSDTCKKHITQGRHDVSHESHTHHRIVAPVSDGLPEVRSGPASGLGPGVGGQGPGGDAQQELCPLLQLLHQLLLGRYAQVHT